MTWRKLNGCNGGRGAREGAARKGGRDKMGVEGVLRRGGEAVVVVVRWLRLDWRQRLSWTSTGNAAHLRGEFGVAVDFRDFHF